MTQALFTGVFALLLLVQAFAAGANLRKAPSAIGAEQAHTQCTGGGSASDPHAPLHDCSICSMCSLRDDSADFAAVAACWFVVVLTPMGEREATRCVAGPDLPPLHRQTPGWSSRAPPFFS